MLFASLCPSRTVRGALTNRLILGAPPLGTRGRRTPPLRHTLPDGEREREIERWKDAKGRGTQRKGGRARREGGIWTGYNPPSLSGRGKSNGRTEKRSLGRSGRGGFGRSEKEAGTEGKGRGRLWIRPRKRGTRGRVLEGGGCGPSPHRPRRNRDRKGNGGRLEGRSRESSRCDLRDPPCRAGKIRRCAKPLRRTEEPTKIFGGSNQGQAVAHAGRPLRASCLQARRSGRPSCLRRLRRYPGPYGTLSTGRGFPPSTVPGCSGVCSHLSGLVLEEQGSCDPSPDSQHIGLYAPLSSCPVRGEAAPPPGRRFTTPPSSRIDVSDRSNPPHPGTERGGVTPATFHPWDAHFWTWRCPRAMQRTRRDGRRSCERRRWPPDPPRG